MFQIDHKVLKKVGLRQFVKDDMKLQIAARVEALASQFGRRLSFSAIGIGDTPHFDALQYMVDAALDYGATAELQLPSTASSSLGNAFSSVATSITSTKTEMRDTKTSKPHKVRDVSRESRKKASQKIAEVNAADFWIYPKSKVKRSVYEEWYEDRKKKSIFIEAKLQHPDAAFVAFSKGPFGEGAERFAYRFFEVL